MSLQPDGVNILYLNININFKQNTLFKMFRIYDLGLQRHWMRKLELVAQPQFLFHFRKFTKDYLLYKKINKK